MSQLKQGTTMTIETINVAKIPYKAKNLSVDKLMALSASPYQTRCDLDGAAQKAADIMARGLLTPLAVYLPADGKSDNRMIRGHLRRASLPILEKIAPERYKELFADGVPCHVYTSLSPAEEQAMATDHGQEKELTRAELYQEVKQLLGTASQDAITFRLRNTLDSICGHKKEAKRKEFAEMELKVASGEMPLSAMIKEYAKYRRGVMSPYYVAPRLPSSWEERFRRQFSGTLLEGERLIDHGLALKLLSAFEASCSGGNWPEKNPIVTFTKRDGDLPWSKFTPNPEFFPIAEKILTPEEKKQDETTTKVLTATELDALISAASCEQVAKLLFAVRHGNAQDVRKMDVELKALLSKGVQASCGNAAR
jgi:hypothetical protein